MKLAQSIFSRRRLIRDSAIGAAALTLPLVNTRTGFAALPSDITELTASQLSTAIRTRQISCVETMQSYLARIDNFNPLYNAIVSRLDNDVCVAQARVADEELARGEYRGWLHGMPYAVKDLADAHDLPTSMGSTIFAGTMPEEDSLHIARVRNAGAIFIGKTNVPEFGMGSQSYNNVFGVTRNAWDPTLTAGGSSGGAASAIASHMLPLADGSDMMGSLRNPAAFNNVIGFRPSPGRVPRAPDDLFYNQLSTNGPMGRNTEDTIRLLDTMAGFHPRAPLMMRDDLPGYDDYNPAALKDLRIAWMGNLDGYLATEPGVLELCEQALRVFESNGSVVDATVPDFDMTRVWESWTRLRHWSHAGRQAMLDDADIRRQLKPEMIFEIEGSIGLTAADINTAAVARTDWYTTLQNMFDEYDLLALPSSQVFPFSADLHWPDEINGRAMDTYHRWMEVVVPGSLAGLPVLNVPVGFDAQGRPMGMQLLGPLGADKAVLESGLAYELVTNHLAAVPELRTRL